MARFYFHVSTPVGFQEDSIGLELKSALIARAEAKAGFRKLLAEEAAKGHDVATWVVIVEDALGRRVVSISRDQLLN